MSRGSDHYRSKLTEDDVRLIRAAVEHRRNLIAEANKLSDTNLAEKMGVTRSSIGRIVYGNSWSHV